MELQPADSRKQHRWLQTKSMQSESKLREFDAEDILCDVETSEVGSGSHGDVVVGQHEVFNTLAIKIFKMCGGIKDKKLVRKKFDKEIGHLQEANHENIVRVFGHVKWPYALGIVMEYCPAGNLRQFILDPDIPVGISLSIRMLTDVASAIAFIHNMFDDKRLIHLDIKPENILLTVELRCKVGDLGSAELVSLSGLTTTTTMTMKPTRIKAITPQYTPPERLLDMSILPSKEHDTYGYGIVIYVVSTRAQPYPAGDQEAILDSIKNGTRPNLSLVRERLEILDGLDRGSLDEVVQLMKKCWNQNPQERPNMVDVKCKMARLLCRQNLAVIREQASNALAQMELNEHRPRDGSRLVPLCRFSTHTRSFPESQQRTIYPPVNRDVIENVIVLAGQTAQGSDATINNQDIPVEDATRRNSELHVTPLSPVQPETLSGGIGSTSRHIRLVQNATPAQQESPENRWRIQDINVQEILACCIMASLAIAVWPYLQNDSDDIHIPGAFVDKIEPLAQNFGDTMRRHQYRDAEDIAKLVSNAILTELVIPPEHLIHIAFYHRHQKNYTKAILFYKISAEHFLKWMKDNSPHSELLECVDGLRHSCESILSDLEWFPLDGKQQLVRHYVIPLMDHIRLQIHSLLSRGHDIACLREFQALLLIQRVQSITGGHALRQNTLKQAVALVKKHCLSTAMLFESYASTLKTLGSIYEDSGNFKKASEYYTEAVAAYKTAKDIDEVNRKEQIKRCLVYIKEAQKEFIHQKLGSLFQE